MSKVLFPGLRVGWMVAPEWLAPSVTLLKQAVDLHTSTLAQKIALRLLGGPDFDRHVGELRDHYRRQAAVLVGALATVFGDRLAVEPPDGGMFLWGRLTDPGVDTDGLLPRALEQGVAYVPGSAFSVTEAHDDCLRLSYATVTPEDLVEGARRLGQVLIDGERAEGRPGLGRPA
jgi:2-aminoadipate transaminase